MKGKKKDNMQSRIEKNCKQCKHSDGGASNKDLNQGHTKMGQVPVIESPSTEEASY